MTSQAASGVAPTRRRAAAPGLGARLRGPAGLLSLAMIAMVAAVVLPPIVILIQNSISTTNPDGSHAGFTASHYARLLSDPKLYTSAWHSVLFAALSTVFSLLLGGLLAWVVERTNAPFKGLAYLTNIVSLGMPFILYILAWMFLLGRAGPLNDLYRGLGGDGVLFAVNSMAGMVLVETFSWLPLVFLLLSATFRAANGEMEEAARMSGATMLDVIRRVSLPMARPAIVATALFVFVCSLEAFDVPVLIGKPGGIDVLTSDIYFSIRAVPPDIGHASAYSVVLTAVIGVLMYFYGRISRRAERFATVTGKSFRPRSIDLGWGRWLGGALVLFNFLVVLALPLLALAWVSFLPFVRSIRLAALSSMTLVNYQAVLQDKGYLMLTVNTLVIAAAAATVTMALMLVAGWLVARRRLGATILDQLTTMPLLLPGIVLGVSMMELALRSPIPLYGTLAIIVIAFVNRYMPYGMRYAFSGALQIHRELEEAASVSGAGTLTMLRRVVAPLLLPALAAGWLFVFLNAAKELTIPLVLAGPRSQTMSAAIFEQASNGQFSELAALGLLWTLLMTVFAVCFYILMRRRSADTFGR
ncbi:iron ABC transporter permease [Inquilinus sp.]|uniref:ABC transporter permease n=1 Tax=Inquilinus sp. TaxID=1932117 RepID=UPI0031DDEBF7